jgi:hypothetical protein
MTTELARYWIDTYMASGTRRGKVHAGPDGRIVVYNLHVNTARALARKLNVGTITEDEACSKGQAYGLLETLEAERAKESRKEEEECLSS